MMHQDIQLTKIKLKIIEGRALSASDAEYLTEGIAMIALYTWLSSQAWPFIKKELRKNGPKLVKKYDLLKTIDARLASSLGRGNEAAGTVLTAYVMSLLDAGTPLEAAINIGKMAATDLTALTVASAVTKMGKDTLEKQQAAKVMDKIKDLEPQAVAYNDHLESNYDKYCMAGDECDTDTQDPSSNLAKNTTTPQGGYPSSGAAAVA
jgi:hypothetical protein